MKQWTKQRLWAVIKGVIAVGGAIATFDDEKAPSFASAFRSVFGYMKFEMYDGLCGEGCCGRKIDAHNIRLYSKYTTTYTVINPETGESEEKTTHVATNIQAQLVVHELGHAFNENAGQAPYDATDAGVRAGSIPDRITNVDDETGNNYGFATGCGHTTSFQQSCDGYHGEEFADMFLGWTYGRWNNSAGGTQRANFMDVNMDQWINTAKNNNR
jgi:hypothetical protein